MSWTDNWEIDASRPVRSGGQGSVTCVIHRDTRRHGALKRLHKSSQQVGERRQRFVREISALERLAVPGVPKMLERGVDDPYAVFEWIEGCTLQEMAGGKPQSLRSSIGIVTSLAHTLKGCHGQGIVHRDIKPANVILTSQGVPYLVDFGIAWSAEHDEDLVLTAMGQELGNRFLRLPELFSDDAKRDPRSDITFLVGVLFFLLTGVAPRNLFDGNGRPPHRALGDRFPLQLVNAAEWRRLTSLFDVGFQVSADLRFQRVDDLIARLSEILSIPDAVDHAAILNTALDEYRAVRKHVDEAIDKIETSLATALNEFRSAFNPLAATHGFKGIPGRAEIVQSGRQAKLLWGLARIESELPRVFIEVLATLEGESRSDVVARMRSLHESPEFSLDLYRGPAADSTRLIEELTGATKLVLANGVRLLSRKVALGS
ncbi:MAG: serine/threonine protein kinase [Ramlibacter sp.]